MPKYRLQRLVFDTTPVGGGMSYSTDFGRQVEALTQDGNRYEQAHVVPQEAPAAEITSLNLGWVFSGESPWNASLDVPIALISGDGLDLYAALQASGVPGQSPSAAHVRHRIVGGLLHLSRLSWSKGGAAEASIRVMGKSADGTTAAIGFASNIAAELLPSSGGTTAYRWVLTGSTFNGVATDCESVEVEFDPALMQEYQRGLPLPVDITGTGAPVSVRVRATTNEYAAAEGNGACSLVFRLLAHGGGLSTAAGSILTISFNGTLSWEEAATGTQGEVSEKTLAITTRHDGTNRPCTWALSNP